MFKQLIIYYILLVAIQLKITKISLATLKWLIINMWKVFKIYLEKHTHTHTHTHTYIHIHIMAKCIVYIHSVVVK